MSVLNLDQSAVFSVGSPFPPQDLSSVRADVLIYQDFARMYSSAAKYEKSDCMPTGLAYILAGKSIIVGGRTSLLSEG